MDYNKSKIDDIEVELVDGTSFSFKKESENEYTKSYSIDAPTESFTKRDTLIFLVRFPDKEVKNINYGA